MSFFSHGWTLITTDLASRYALAGLRDETLSEKNSLGSVLIHVDNKVNAIALNLNVFWQVAAPLRASGMYTIDALREKNSLKSV